MSPPLLNFPPTIVDFSDEFARTYPESHRPDKKLVIKLELWFAALSRRLTSRSLDTTQHVDDVSPCSMPPSRRLSDVTGSPHEVGLLTSDRNRLQIC